MKELEYPFDSEYLLKKSKRLKRELLSDGAERTRVRIAVLGGSTTHDILRILELFLLNEGIEPEFYESEYAQYWQDALFPGEELRTFRPELVIVHTTTVNLPETPRIGDGAEELDRKLSACGEHFRQLWDALREHFGCPVIQNNFEYPAVRLLGNRDAADPHGLTNFVSRMNALFAEEIRRRQGLYLCDINYLSARVGLDRWSDPLYWHLYKYAVAVPVIPELSFQYANLIKAIYGKNRKALVLDLDNTLWGGVIGDDGVEGIELGQETGPGQSFLAFQKYLRSQKDLGVMLAVNSKNDEENALMGLRHPDGVLRPEDFVCIRANWEPKSRNFGAIAGELNILPESMVFVDDNPAERMIVAGEYPGAAVPELGDPENYIRAIDHAGYFENITLSEDDRKRSEMMRENVLRREAEQRFADYGDYLRSLNMRAEIVPFAPLYYPRIAQLTNKSNQFNVTTRRYTEEEIRRAAEDPRRITLCGRLSDRFGDNGIVSLCIGRIGADAAEETLWDASPQEGAVSAETGPQTAQGAAAASAGGKPPASPESGQALHIELFLMSCRVLKRDMELAMLDTLIGACRDRKLAAIYGYYLPTAKNHMVEKLYGDFGFAFLAADEDGRTVWRLSLSDPGEQRNRYIEVQTGGGDPCTAFTS